LALDIVPAAPLNWYSSFRTSEYQLSRQERTVLDDLDLQDRAYQSIRRKILEGRVRTRKDLSRRVLQAELGVSSICVQMALARLEGERLLESRPQSGTYIRQIDFREYCDHYAVRECLEPYAAGRAARNITAAQLKRVEQSCRDYTEVEKHFRTGPGTMNDDVLDASVRAERLFHGTIMEASGNTTAAHIIETLSTENYNRLTTAGLPPAIFLNLTELAIKDHRRILAALKSGDARKAERAMRYHLHRACLYVKNLNRS
jgi:DNA-binding GntR family transcriptional regulator